MTTLVTPPQLVTPEVDIDLIDIKDGPNTRRRLDPIALKELASDIERKGIVEPLVIERAVRTPRQIRAVPDREGTV